MSDNTLAKTLNNWFQSIVRNSNTRNGQFEFIDEVSWPNNWACENPYRGSRDFVSWMDTVPEREQAGKGLKALVFNMNPSLDAGSANLFAENISAAAEKFPSFCNSGDETKDV